MSDVTPPPSKGTALLAYLLVCAGLGAAWVATSFVLSRAGDAVLSRVDALASGYLVGSLCLLTLLVVGGGRLALHLHTFSRVPIVLGALGAISLGGLILVFGSVGLFFALGAGLGAF